MDSHLLAWKRFANSVLSPAERTKDELRPVIEDYKRSFPSWVQNNDARWAWFTGAKRIIQTAQLGYVYIRDQLTDVLWWKKKVLEYKPDEIADHIKEFEVFLRLGFSNTLFVITEETLRSIVRSIDSAACNGARAAFNNIYGYLLKYSNRQQYRSLFDFHRLIRNTMHTNGLFCPRNNRNRSIEFMGKQYDFVVGERIGFLTFDLCLALVSQYRGAMVDVFGSERIRSIPHVERFEW